jgi:3-hydroxyisobutyrate dehydrogenase
MTPMSIAVIGIGAIGAPIARRLKAGGFDLWVCDTNKAATDPFLAENVKVAAKPSDCAGADVVLIVVSTPDQAMDAILGECGVVAGVQEVRSPIIAVISTISAQVVRDIAHRLRDTRVRLIDAPVSGGGCGAEAGALTMLTGGNESDIEAAKSVFDQLATTRIHCGPLGSAQTLKIINNSLGIANTIIAGEAYRLAIEQGIAPALASEVFEACSGRNARSKDPAGPQTGYVELARTRAAYDGIRAITRKDLGLALEMAAHTKGDYPALTAIKSLVDSLASETFETWRRIAGLPPDVL